MNLKILSMGIAALTVYCSASAQDKIYKRNGDVIEARITEISPRNVSYRQFNNPDGPVYSIGKGDVDKVVYENGVEDHFNEGGNKMPGRHLRGRYVNEPFGKSIIAAAPFDVSENGVGAGISYECTLDKHGIISFYLPVSVTVNHTDYDNYYYGGTYGPVPTHTMFHAMPGVKIYPTGNRGVVKYSVGPSFVIATGNGDYDEVYNNGNYSPLGNHFLFGMMIMNSLNINPSPHLFMSLDFGVGGSYVSQIDGLTQRNEALVQFAYRIGYRF